MVFNADKKKNFLPTAIFLMLAIAAVTWCVLFLFFPQAGQDFLFLSRARTNFFFDYFCPRATADMPMPYVENCPCPYLDTGILLRQDECYPALANLWVGLFPADLIGAATCTLIGVCVFVWGLVLFLGRYVPGKVLITAVVACSSAPFLFAVTVGNLILYAVGFSLVFLAWYDSASRWRRSVAAVALALASVVKITPALLGVLYLGRGWRTRIRYVVLSAGVAILLFIVPFMFCGGWEAVTAWVENAAMNSAAYTQKNGIGLYGLFSVAIRSFYMGQAPWWVLRVLRIASVCLGVLVLALGSSRGNDPWAKGYAVVLGMLFIPPTMMCYTALYVLPFVITGMYHHNDRMRNASAVYCFSLCMLLRVPLLFGAMDSLNVCFAAAASIDVAVVLSQLLLRKNSDENGSDPLHRGAIK